MTRTCGRLGLHTVLSLLAFLTFLTISALSVGGCESYDNGVSKSKRTTVTETPYEKKTTTTTHEKKVEPY